MSSLLERTGKEDTKKFPKFEQCDMLLAQLIITNWSTYWNHFFVGLIDLSIKIELIVDRLVDIRWFLNMVELIILNLWLNSLKSTHQCFYFESILFVWLRFDQLLIGSMVFGGTVFAASIIINFNPIPKFLRSVKIVTITPKLGKEKR